MNCLVCNSKIMFLYRLLRIFAGLMALTFRLSDWSFTDFPRDLDLNLELFRSNMEFAISQPKTIRLP